VYEFEPACMLGVKLAGVHWWHKSRSHAAELTAGGIGVTPPGYMSTGQLWLSVLPGELYGVIRMQCSPPTMLSVSSMAERPGVCVLVAGYYNTRDRNGYAPLLAVLARHSARVSFTCVEMRDCEHPPEARCSPQGAPPCSDPGSPDEDQAQAQVLHQPMQLHPGCHQDSGLTYCPPGVQACCSRWWRRRRRRGCR
jgi:hypothetical protein